jgi:hypothetical protein
LTFPLFEHHDVQLWIPEVGGAVDPAATRTTSSWLFYGGMSKGERNRIKIRVVPAGRWELHTDDALPGECRRPPRALDLGGPASLVDNGSLRQSPPAYSSATKRALI